MKKVTKTYNPPLNKETVGYKVVDIDKDDRYRCYYAGTCLEYGTVHKAVRSNNPNLSRITGYEPGFHAWEHLYDASKDYERSLPSTKRKRKSECMAILKVLLNDITAEGTDYNGSKVVVGQTLSIIERIKH